MMSAVSGENEFKILTITHLKMCLDAEHNMLKMLFFKQYLIIIKRRVRINFSNSCMMVIIYLINKSIMLLEYSLNNQFFYSNAILLSFRKPLTREDNKVAESSEEVCSECFNKEFNDMFSSSAKDIAASAVANELNVTCIQVIKWALVLLEN